MLSKIRKILPFAAGCGSLVVSYYIGMALSALASGYVSPSVAGMVVLFVLLKTGIVKENWIKAPANLLLDNLMLFFIPVTAGVALISFSSLKADVISIIVAATASTWFVLWIVGVVTEKIEKR
jgi:holin-like protein